MHKPTLSPRDTASHPRVRDARPGLRRLRLLLPGRRRIRPVQVRLPGDKPDTQGPPEEALAAPLHEACPYGNMPRSAGSGHWSEWHRGHGCHLDPDHKRDTICELLRQLGRKHPDQRLGQLIANVLDPGWELRHSLSRIEDDIIERKLRAAIEHGIEAAWRTR